MRVGCVVGAGAGAPQARGRHRAIATCSSGKQQRFGTSRESAVPTVGHHQRPTPHRSHVRAWGVHQAHGCRRSRQSAGRRRRTLAVTADAYCRVGGRARDGRGGHRKVGAGEVTRGRGKPDARARHGRRDAFACLAHRAAGRGSCGRRGASSSSAFIVNVAGNDSGGDAAGRWRRGARVVRGGRRAVEDKAKGSRRLSLGGATRW